MEQKYDLDLEDSRCEDDTEKALKRLLNQAKLQSEKLWSLEQSTREAARKEEKSAEETAYEEAGLNRPEDFYAKRYGNNHWEKDTYESVPATPRMPSDVAQLLQESEIVGFTDSIADLSLESKSNKK